MIFSSALLLVPLTASVRLSSQPTTCQWFAALGTAEFKSDVTVVKEGPVCLFESSGFKFSMAAPILPNKAQEIFHWEKRCSESKECRELGDQLRVVSTLTEVKYKGAIFSLYGDEMKSLKKIEEKAKRVLCEREGPEQFPDFTFREKYMISNQKVDGCELTLYVQQSDTTALIRTVEYEDLVYRDNDPTSISFANTWDAAVKPNHADQIVDFNWCRRGQLIKLNWKGATRTATVMEDTLVDGILFGRLFPLKCKVKLATDRAEQVSISLFHRVTLQ